MDNLNIYKIYSLYKAFKRDMAMYIASKLDIYYTPVHKSW